MKLEHSLVRLGCWLRRRLWITVPPLALILPLPWALGLANPSYIAVTVVLVLLGLAFAMAESHNDRILFLGVFGVSFILQQVAHVALFWLGSTAGGPFLGPDSASYFRLSFEVAELGFPSDLFLASKFGSYDIAHLYLFGAAIELLNADLFCLQLINAGFMALVAGLTYSWSRIALPRYATLLGTAVALFPSSIILTSLDLLKDPTVTFSLVLGVWALFKLTRADTRTAQAVYVVTGALGLAYLHMARFYLLTHFEIAIGCAMVVFLFHRLRSEGRAAWRESRPGFVVSVVLLLVLAELGPWLVGWPVSPLFYLRNMQRIQDVPAMTDYGPGLLDQLVTSPTADREHLSPDRVGRSPEAAPVKRGRNPSASPSPGGADSVRPEANDPSTTSGELLTTLRRTLATPPAPAPAPTPAPDPAPAPGPAPRAEREEDAEETPATPDPASSDSQPTRRPEQLPSEATNAEPPGPLVISALRALDGAIDLFRRFYGPFVWVVPATWSAERILTRDYLYYPGMLVWYALWPLIAAGFLRSGRDLLRGRRIPYGLAVLNVYCILTLAQYTLLNLSYRQRDTLFALVVVFALIGFSSFREHRVLRYAYGLYWVLIFGVAAAHLLLRYRLLELASG